MRWEESTLSTIGVVFHNMARKCYLRGTGWWLTSKATSQGKLKPHCSSPPAGSSLLSAKFENWGVSVRTRHIRKVYPTMPFNIVESELSRELEIYYQAIYSYPDHFARTRLTFEQHLLNMMSVVQTAQIDGSECMRSA